MKLIKTLAIFGAIAFLFSACTQSASSSADERDIMADLFPEMRDINNEYEAELYFNYEMLDLFYIYAHMRNELADDYKVYLNKGTSQDSRTKGYCSVDYYDVCYMYNQMADPFTRYFDPLVADQIYSSILESESIVGIGAEVEEQLDSTSRYLLITDVYSGSPAEKAGLKAGDIVVQVDGLNITSATNFENMCTGDKGDVINIVVTRNSEPLSVKVTVDEYNEPSVKLTYQDSIPVIQIKEFVVTSISDSGSYGEFVTALKKTEGATSTIIDLRGNPGGETEQCANMAAELLSAGDTVVIDIEATIDSISNGRGMNYFQIFDTLTVTAEHDGIGKNRYYVFMADTGSASCAETMLSALTANRKVPVVGMLTYGKGIGQLVIQTDVGKGLALVTALQGFDKNWESYHDLGIVPDFEIDDPDAQMAKAVELAKEAQFARSAGYGSQKLNHFSKEHEYEASGRIPTAKDLKLRYKIAK